MRRFLLFAGSTYYPLGGMADFIYDFESLEKAEIVGHFACDVYGKIWIEEELLGKIEMEVDWWHVYDSEQRKIVAHS